MSPFRRALSDHLAVVRQMPDLESAVGKATELAVVALGDGNPLLLCGNGGSATDAEHIAGELVGRFLMERKSLPAIALGQGIASQTAIANDYGYDEVFARQVDGYGRPGAVLFAFSTSGNSRSILTAAARARSIRMAVVGFTGRSGGQLAELCDVLINIPSDVTARIQEMHIMVGHAICDGIERALFGAESA